MTHVGSILEGKKKKNARRSELLGHSKMHSFFLFFFLSSLKQLFYLAHSSAGQESGQDLPRCLLDIWGLKGPILKIASSRTCQHALLFHFGLHFGRTYKHFQNSGIVGISLVVQWLRLHAHNPGVWSSIPSQGTTSHTWQLKDRACRNQDLLLLLLLSRLSHVRLCATP